MPLYVPKEFIALTFGHALSDSRKRQWWEYNENTLDETGLNLAQTMSRAEETFLMSINNAADFYKHYRSVKKNSFRFFEAVSYSAAYADLNTADVELKDCLVYIKKKEDFNNIYVKQVYNNTEKLSNGDRKSILNKWETLTRKALKI